MPGKAAPTSSVFSSRAERSLLLRLQRSALCYFLDNQSPRTGWVLDRQHNFGPITSQGMLSISATGMGFIAVALASAAPHRLVSRREALTRINRGLETARYILPHTKGILPHFINSNTGRIVGADARSTIDSAWFTAGALWAATFLEDPGLTRLAQEMFDRIDWRFWTGPNGLIRHGADRRRQPFPCCWDRLNGETVFMYVLAAGAEADRAWPCEEWVKLRRMAQETAGLYFSSADLGLFVFQYGLDLLDLKNSPLPGAAELTADAALAAEANARICRNAADKFRTYSRFWGLSACDGPAHLSPKDVYRAYSPSEPLDGTAHVTATIASIAHRPDLVWRNIHEAESEKTRPILGRYGFSSLNLDREWVGRDMIGIDAGAICLALDNCLFDDRVRRMFHSIGNVRRGLARIGSTLVGDGALRRIAA